MIAAHSPVQAGPAAVVTAAVRGVPGVWQTASVAGPCEVIVGAGTRDAGRLARLVTSGARAPGGGRRAGGGPVVYRWETRSPGAHRTTIEQRGGGGVQAVCSCGWRSAVFGPGKATGTTDPLQHAAEAADLHEGEMSGR